MVLSNGSTCDGGRRRLNWSQFCDGIFDCVDRFDEEGHFCKRCINNLYSCPPKDDIRCDLACQMLHYVPCQTIQDRRACNYMRNDDNYQAFFQLLEKFKVFIVIGVSILLILIGIIVLIKCTRRRIIKPSNRLSDKINNPIETDTLSSHIYEQCYDSSSLSYKLGQRYHYYEHIV